jgi:23S rRNA pseudouridine1911/1915/1917 synthase
VKGACPGVGSTARIEVPPASAGVRLDAFLGGQVPELSRTRAAQLIGEERVRLNGRIGRKSDRVQPGDVVEVEIPPPEPSAVEAEAIPLEILFEDADLLVLSKPAGLVVHPAPGHRSGTLVNALLHHVRDLSGIGGVKRPGIVHRLDKDTSGLMLVAKHDRAHRRLAAALKRREIRRTYVTACWGHLAVDRITVEAPVGRSGRDRKRMAVVEGGRPAMTHLMRLERWPAADLLEAELETGRTHQIRVHLAYIGHPVIGDPVYGGGGARGISGPDRVWARELEKRVPRQFLHARRLDFRHPRTDAPMSMEAPLPEDLASVVEWVRTPRAT